MYNSSLLFFIFGSLLCLGATYDYSNITYELTHHYSISGVGYGPNRPDKLSLRFSTAFDKKRRTTIFWENIFRAFW